MTKRTILITGNPVEGFTFIGPFDNKDTAIRFAEDTHQGADWWISDLTDPAEYGKQVVAL